MTSGSPVHSEQPSGATPAGDQLGDAGKKALDEERKARRDAERRERELAARVEELEAADLRRDVAAAKGLTTAQAKRLQGATREELEADADEILEVFRPGGATPPPTTKPKPDLKGGGDPTEDSYDAANVADRILGRAF